jgi:hypothetical protein
LNKINKIISLWTKASVFLKSNNSNLVVNSCAINALCNWPWARNGVWFRILHVRLKTILSLLFHKRYMVFTLGSLCWANCNLMRIWLIELDVILNTTGVVNKNMMRLQIWDNAFAGRAISCVRPFLHRFSAYLGKQKYGSAGWRIKACPHGGKFQTIEKHCSVSQIVYRPSVAKARSYFSHYTFLKFDQFRPTDETFAFISRYTPLLI